MTSETYATDEFDSWMTFSPKQRPLELPDCVPSNMLDKPSRNGSSIQSNYVSPIDSGCRSKKDYLGSNSPSSPSLVQGQLPMENFVPSVDTPFGPTYSAWYNPFLSPSLDSSQNFLNDELKCEWKTEAKSSNFGTLSAAQKKRREQNRAAQRNFRQRKEFHLKHLESTIVNVEARRNSLQQDNDYLQHELARISIENNRLRRGPPCNRHNYATDGRLRPDMSSSSQKMYDKNLCKTLQVTEDEKTIKIITKTPKREDSQDSNEPGVNGHFVSSDTIVDKEKKSDLRNHVPSRIDDNPESPVNCESSRSSTIGSVNTNYNAKDSNNSNCTTSSSSRAGSMSNTSCEPSSYIPICDSCNRQRLFKGRSNEIKVKDMEDRNSARVLMCSQKALKNIQSHELFQKGFIDIEQLLCALRQIVRYYEGTAVFDRTELESIMRDCARYGQSDELI